jgi:hypothetical protein
VAGVAAEGAVSVAVVILLEVLLLRVDAFTGELLLLLVLVLLLLLFTLDSGTEVAVVAALDSLGG